MPQLWFNFSETKVSITVGRLAKLTPSSVGTSHLAVQVADVLLHWFDSSFVYIKEWKGKGGKQSNSFSRFFEKELTGCQSDGSLLSSERERRRSPTH